LRLKGQDLSCRPPAELNSQASTFTAEIGREGLLGDVGQICSVFLEPDDKFGEYDDS